MPGLDEYATDRALEARAARIPLLQGDHAGDTSMQGGLKNSYESVKAFSETEFHEDLKKFDVPTLLMHGEDDQ